jgi:hypothetical protein
MTPGKGAGSLIDIRAERTSERWVNAGRVIEATANAPNSSFSHKARKRHVDHSAASQIKEVFRHECLAWPQALNVLNYPLLHRFHA